MKRVADAPSSTSGGAQRPLGPAGVADVDRVHEA